MKILVVDDEPGIARELADGIDSTDLGKCFAAESANTAVEIVNREKGIDVLVTDISLNDVDGFTLHEAIHHHLPDLCTIFLSEYNYSSEHSDRAKGCPILAKPVDAKALADFIRSYCLSRADAIAPDLMVGTRLGEYRIEALLGSDLDGNFYHAVQSNIERDVELHMLDAVRANDPREVARFLADVRVKAKAHHPALLSVFEAGQQGGIHFYTSELRSGFSLADLAIQGAKFDSGMIFQLLHSVTEVMVYLNHEKIAHEPLKAGHVMIDHRSRTRLINIAISTPSEVTVMQEMQYLAAMVMPMLSASDQYQRLRQLLFEMESESVTLRSWNALLYEVKRAASGNLSPHSHRLDPSGRAAIEEIGVARRRQRVFRQGVMVITILILMVVAGFVAWMMVRAKSKSTSSAIYPDVVFSMTSKVQASYTAG